MLNKKDPELCSKLLHNSRHLNSPDVTTQGVDVVLGRPVDFGDEDLEDRIGEVVEHAHHLTPMWNSVDGGMILQDQAVL